MKNNLAILVGGDIAPIRKNYHLFEKEDPTKIFTSILEVLKSSDFSIINLEVPLILEQTPIDKTGPIFSGKKEFLSVLKNSGIKAVSLANNHILDHGHKGLQSTLDACTEFEMLYVGAGKNAEEAKMPLIVNIKGKRIAFYAMADREFSIAEKDSPGANPTDLINYCRMIRKYKDKFDFLIVLLHEGIQHYPLPYPDLRKLCHFLVEEGADTVICQHSHVPGAFEKYLDKPIIYGQGDFISDSISIEMDPRGYLVYLNVIDNIIDFSPIPFIQLPDGGVKKMDVQEEKAFFEELETINLILNDPEQLEKSWNDYCKKQKDNYWAQLRGYNRVQRYLNRKLNFIDKLDIRRISILLNLFRCSAHSASMKQILKNRYEEQTK